MVHSDIFVDVIPLNIWHLVVWYINVRSIYKFLWGEYITLVSCIYQAHSLTIFLGDGLSRAASLLTGKRQLNHCAAQLQNVYPALKRKCGFLLEVKQIINLPYLPLRLVSKCVPNVANGGMEPVQLWSGSTCGGSRLPIGGNVHL